MTLPGDEKDNEVRLPVSQELEQFIERRLSISSRQPREEVTATPESATPDYPRTRLETFLALTRFILPLIVTQMVPDIAEQALNRGITSIAGEEMVSLLASFGLAFYVTRFISCGSLEVRAISVVLVHSKRDNMRMTLFCVGVGVTLTTLQLIVSLSPIGMWLIRDIHQQTEEVSVITCRVMSYLAPVASLEAISYYYEGGLIYQKLTHYAGIAKFADFGFQVLFVIILLFTPTRTDPILIPLFALYAGYIGRLILTVGFWFILARRELPPIHLKEKPATYFGAFKFWIPLAIVRFVQTVTRPIINLVVSRTLAESVSKESATEAIAVLTAVYPTGRIVFSWLNDLRTIIPTFHKNTSLHRKIPLKTLSLYGAFCTLVVFLVHSILFIIPGPAYFIMHTIIGLTPHLAQLCLTPLKIFAGLCLCVGFRATLSGILIMRKQTVFLTPSAVARFIGLVVVLATLPLTSLSGAELGITCLLLSFVVEALFLAITFFIIRLKPEWATCSCWKRKKLETKETEEEGEPGESSKLQSQ